MLDIDGSYGKGGGQLLRTAVPLSAHVRGAPPLDYSVLLDIVRAVVTEVHPAPRALAVIDPDASFDRDLGLDSLARVELLLRVERTFGVTLPENTLQLAETSRVEYPGAFAAAAHARVSVVPVAIRGSRPLLRAGQWLPRPGPLVATIGEPVAPPDTPQIFAAAITLRDSARAAILRHCGEPDAARSALATGWPGQ